jgi:hypothetical protein
VVWGELLVLVARPSQARAGIPAAGQELAVLEAEPGRKAEALQMRPVVRPALEHSVAAADRPICRVAAWAEAETLEAVAPAGRQAVALLLPVVRRGEPPPLLPQAGVLATWALLVNQNRRDLTCSLASCRSFAWLDVRAGTTDDLVADKGSTK